MAIFNKREQSLPTSREAVQSAKIRRPLTSGWTSVKESLIGADMIMVTMLSSVSLMAFLPQSWIVALPGSLLYYLWASSQKFRLPFKVPQGWGGKDYGAPKPGSRKFNTAASILYFGQDQATNEELWIENGDARRHGFYLGTTGSGKALPVDTPILTPSGWVRLDGLQPGDLLSHPDGSTSRILSVHPQGVIPSVRLWFADGRHADCSRDHLWHVDVKPRAPGARDADLPDAIGFKDGGRTMEAADIGILQGARGDHYRISVPISRPHNGLVVTDGSHYLSQEHALLAANAGFDALGYMPSLYGSPEQRVAFLKNWSRAADVRLAIEEGGICLKGLSATDIKALKQIAWSLGGTATSFRKGARSHLVIRFSGIEQVWPEAIDCQPPEDLEIIEVEALSGPADMTCIKIDRDDGLFIMENHIVTHNTELLLGNVSQTLMWSSGFLFIDGKGTKEFYARVWSLAKRFGREDDVRLLNFTDAGGDPDAPAGGPSIQSNTLNPFSRGGSDQLMNLIVGLMGDAGQQNDMWKNRAMSLVTAAMKALVQMRDAGDILLDVQTIRDFLPLGVGVNKKLAAKAGRPITTIDEIPEEVMAELRTRGGMIELLIRARRGDFSNASRLALEAFFNTLPGFNLSKALKGEDQDAKASEQYGFLSMQLTKPLGSLADDYGHIFRTPLGEVDIDDIVLNRRILIVLLPALQKAPEEMQMCGKIIVNLVKIMMGNASGSTVHGSKREIIDSKQTRAPSPFIVVLDEAGYYMVKGIDTMMAQARALGFMIIIAGQDMAAMQSISPQIAETAAANASTFAAGKTVDGDKTLSFIQKIFGRTQVSVSSGYQAQSGLIGTKWVDRMDVSFQEVDRVKLDELQGLKPSEFYFLFEGVLVRASTFFIGEEYAQFFAVNKFLKVRGPMDRVPGLDQEQEIKLVDAMVQLNSRIFELIKAPDILNDHPVSMDDILSLTASTASSMLWSAGRHAANPRNIHNAWLAAAMSVADQMQSGDDDTTDPDDFDEWDTDIPTDTDFLPDEDEPLLRREQSGRGASFASRAGSDIDNDEDEDDIVSSLTRAARGQTPHDRYSGMIDLLVSQDRAREKARSDEYLAEHMDEAEEQERSEAEVNRQSMGEFFNFIAENSQRFAKIFAEENVDGALGLEILKRSKSVSPVPLEKIPDEDYAHVAVAELEKAIATEQK